MSLYLCPGGRVEQVHQIGGLVPERWCHWWERRFVVKKGCRRVVVSRLRRHRRLPLTQPQHPPTHAAVLSLTLNALLSFSGGLGWGRVRGPP